MVYSFDHVIKTFGKYGVTPLRAEKQKPLAGCLEALFKGGKIFPYSPCRFADCLLGMMERGRDAVRLGVSEADTVSW